MFFKRVNKKVWGFSLFSLLFLVMIVYSVDMAKAATVEVGQDADKTYVCFNRKTGVFTDTASSAAGCKEQGYGQSSVKIINNDYAYCVNWKLKYKSDSKYEAVSSWKDTSENAIKAGFLINYIQEVNGSGYDKNKAYSNAAATLNTLFATKENDSGSYNFSSNSEFSGYLSKADNYYKEVKSYMTKTLPKPTISVDGNPVLSYDDGIEKYFSSKITIGNLYKTYGGDNDIVTYTLSAKAGNNSVSICSDASGKDCKTGDVSICRDASGNDCDVTISEKNTHSFYIFVDKTSVNEGASITVNIKGSNKSTYYSSVLYDDTVYENTQKLITLKEIPYSRSTNNSEKLLVPGLNNHWIHAYKVDENGDNLEGATLEIYKDVVSGNPVASNNGSGYDVTYTTPTVTDGEDDFYNHDYWLVEKKAPSGFIIGTEPIKIYTKGVGGGTGLVCYFVDSETGVRTEEKDQEHCYPEKYEYMCQHTTTDDLEPVEEDGNCKTTTSEVEPLNNDNEYGINAVENEIELNSVYKKVCYNKVEGKISEIDYCSNKGSYTKVWNGGDGNINIKKPNTKNLVKISKQDMANDEELIGASLKVCTENSYNDAGIKCDAGTTVDGIVMSWVSDDTPHSIYGLAVGTYYIVEETPPSGYLQATIATEFSINEKGEVTTGGKTITYDNFVTDNASIVIGNKITEITISKQDMATSKELPGARLSICRTYEENGEIQMLVDQYSGDCIEAVLAGGEIATWVSTNKPKEIKGLEPGTYYLVERIAPTDYSTAESILFTLKSDGTLVDKDGVSISDKKITMKDEPIEDKKTGSFSTYVVLGIVLVTLILGGGSYYYINKKHKNIDNEKNSDISDKKKIRRRKIHNKK